MGEISDLTFDGTICQSCGAIIDEEPSDHPRDCADCQRTTRHDRQINALRKAAVPTRHNKPFNKIIGHLERECRKAGLVVRECGAGHYQIMGGRKLVNFYPSGKKGPTIYVDKAPGSIRGKDATVEKAIKLACPVAMPGDCCPTCGRSWPVRSEVDVPTVNVVHAAHGSPAEPPPFDVAPTKRPGLLSRIIRRLTGRS